MATFKTVTIQNETGLHARPASMVVKEAKNYESDIKIVKGTEEANAKSIMGVMSLCISKNTDVTIRANGSDEESAVDALVELIESGFGEE